METIITRDSDVIREYLAALDAGERGLSPFARLAATIKLARLRRELASTPLETTDEDLASLRREIDERLNRSLIRRIQSRNWGARASIFLMIVAGQQAILFLVLLATWLFVRFAPAPRRWNPLFPHEQPAFLYTFIFLFLFVTPFLALLVVFGGRYARAWRRTLPITLLLIALSAVAAYLIVPIEKRDRVPNPALQASTSIEQFARRRGLPNRESYRQWVDSNWLLKDALLRSDYEAYLRRGPGRWITSRFPASDDAAWRDSLDVMEQYLDGGQDVAGLREWLKYYLDRNRIYGEGRIDQEVASIAGEANQPFLKERDQRLYRAHLGAVSNRMKNAALIGLAATALVFLAAFAAAPLMASLTVARRQTRQMDAEATMEQTPARPLRHSFPERSDIKSMPFYDAPFDMLTRAHRSFLRLAVFASVFVFVFWIALYALAFGSGSANPPSQVGLMRSFVLVVPNQATPQSRQSASQRVVSVAPELAVQLKAIEGRLDEGEYEFTKEFEAQGVTLASQRADIDQLRSFSSQFQQTTSTLPTQLAELSTRATAAEARVGEVMGQVSGIKQKADALEGQLSSKIGQVESRASRASEQIGKIEEQASGLATRTEALEKELDRRARQIEARTEELGERTAALRDREERLTRFQRIAFGAILSGIRADVDELDRRSQSGRAEVQRAGEAIAQRINAMIKDLTEINTDQSKQFIDQLDELKKRLDQILARAK